MSDWFTKPRCVRPTPIVRQLRARPAPAVRPAITRCGTGGMAPEPPARSRGRSDASSIRACRRTRRRTRQRDPERLTDLAAAIGIPSPRCGLGKPIVVHTVRRREDAIVGTPSTEGRPRFDADGETGANCDAATGSSSATERGASPAERSGDCCPRDTAPAPEAGARRESRVNVMEYHPKTTTTWDSCCGSRRRSPARRGRGSVQRRTIRGARRPHHRRGVAAGQWNVPGERRSNPAPCCSGVGADP